MLTRTALYTLVAHGMLARHAVAALAAPSLAALRPAAALEAGVVCLARRPRASRRMPSKTRRGGTRLGRGRGPSASRRSFGEIRAAPRRPRETAATAAPRERHRGHRRRRDARGGARRDGRAIPSTFDEVRALETPRARQRRGARPRPRQRRGSDTAAIGSAAGATPRPSAAPRPVRDAAAT